MRNEVLHTLRSEGRRLGLVTALAFLLHGLLGVLPTVQAAGVLCSQEQEQQKHPTHTCAVACLTVCASAIALPAGGADSPRVTLRAVGEVSLFPNVISSVPRWRARGDPIRGPPSTRA